MTWWRPASLANQVRSLLEGFWPGGAAISTDVDSPIALAFLERFLAHAYCRRRAPAALLARLRVAPAGRTGAAETKGEMDRALVAVLAPLVARIAELSARIRHAGPSSPTAAS